MPIKFEIQMTEQSLFDFMMNRVYTGKGGLITIIIGAVNVFLLVRSVMEKRWGMSGMFLLFAFAFLGLIPLIIKNTVKKQLRTSEKLKTPVQYEFCDSRLEISHIGEKSVYEWTEFSKVFETRKSVILLTKKTQAFIFPKEQIREQYENLVKLFQLHLDTNQVKLRRIQK